MSPSVAAAWEETRTRRQREQEALRRAQAEYMQQQMQAATEQADTASRVQIEAEMQALAARTSQRMRNAVRRDDAAYRAQVQFAQASQVVSPVPFPPAQPIQEGSPPVPLPAFETSLVLTEEVRARRSRIQNSWEAAPADLTAEQARFELGKAIDMAVQTKLFDEWRGLLLVGASGINVEPIPVSDVRVMLFTLLAQAVQSKLLSPNRARVIAGIVNDAPKKVKDETPAEITIPETVDPTDLAGLRTLALDTVTLDGSPLTPKGLKEAGDTLQQLARVVPELVDRLETLEAMVYESLIVRPCHEGHVQHLQTTSLCAEQASDLAFTLMAELGLFSRQLPRDVHRDPDGERASCCKKDGRIGTWLVYGQYVNPDLQSRPVVRQGKARPQILDDIAEAGS